MSKIYENEYGFYVSHKRYIDHIYKDVNNGNCQLNPNLFKISRQYNSNKNSKQPKAKSPCDAEIANKCDLNNDHEVKHTFEKFNEDLLIKNILNNDKSHLVSEDNNIALETSQYIYEETRKALINNAFGSNNGPATIKTINNFNFLFPENSTFYAKDVQEIDMHLKDTKYDLIVLDPPWWNKYIRRKRKHSTDGYDMMFNADLKRLPINTLLNESGLLVVWCTNSKQHLSYLLEEIFSKWELEFVSKWYWMKITTNGKPVCNFSEPPGKQPFEQIIFGRRKCSLSVPTNGKLVVSVPSALHSHKPPLFELVKPFLSDNPSCLEIFARYLLPGWTSYGNEVLRLQHESVFVLD